MKKISVIIFGLLFAATVFALNTPPTSKQSAYLKNQNKIINPGAENGTAKVTVSAGTLTATTTAAEIGTGARGFKWCPAASGNTLSFSQYVVEPGLKSNNGEASVLALTSGTGYALRVFDGTSVLSSTSTLTPSSNYQNWSDNFVYPSSGSLTINAIAGNPSNCIFLDDAYLGTATNVGTVSQAQFVGSAYFPQTANCIWSRTNTAIGTFGTDADCPGPTVDKQVVGSWQTTDSDLPRVTINNLPPGIYKVTATGSLYGAGDWTMAISDGTNTRGYASGSGNGGASFNPANVSTAWFEYTTAGNRSFEIYGSSSSGAISLSNEANNDRITFIVEKYPLQSQQIVAADQGDYGWTSYTPTFTGWGTPTGVECVHARLSTNLLLKCKYTSGTTTATEARVSLPGVLVAANTMSIPSLQTVGVAFSAAAFAGSVSVLAEPGVGYVTFGLQGGSNAGLTKVNGNAFASSTQLAWFASIPIEGWQQNQRAPVLVNSVLSSYEGAMRVEAAEIANNGTASIASQFGSWVASVSRAAAGRVTVTFTTGKFSAAPVCLCNSINDTGVSEYRCSQASSVSKTSTQYGFETVNGGATLTDRNFSIVCMGPR